MKMKDSLDTIGVFALAAFVGASWLAACGAKSECAPGSVERDGACVAAGDGDADAGADADSDSDTGSDADGDTDADVDTDADADSDADGDTDADADTDADGDADDACASECDGGLYSTCCPDGDGSASCHDLTSDRSNCGGCGHLDDSYACRPEEANLCRLGNCVCGVPENIAVDPAPCAGPRTCCGDGDLARCADLQTDHGNCGACGIACGPGQRCLDGLCVCHEGWSLCGGVCRDTNDWGVCNDVCVDLRNESNCGTCGNVCDEDRECTEGACVCTDDTHGNPRLDCRGSCVRHSIFDCSECGDACPDGWFCSIENGQFMCMPWP